MHDDINARLSAYLDGELSDEERASLEAELTTSEDLRANLEELRRVRDWARDFPGRMPANEVWASIEQDIAGATVDEVPRNARRSSIVRLFERFPFGPSRWSQGTRRLAVIGLAGIALAGMGRSMAIEREADWFEAKNRLQDLQLIEMSSAGDWNQTATALRGQNGSLYQMNCPRFGTSSSVWGTDVYTDDSSVCTAAVHAGLISFEEGGPVTLRIRPGYAEYDGSLRNGVETRDWGDYSGSFEFVTTGERPRVAIQAEWIGWGESAGELRGLDGARVTYQCPANGEMGAVWGTGTYTDDSSICTAGVHAGVITTERGGVVTIEIRPGRPRYRGSDLNGVETRNYGSWEGSFVVVDGDDEPVLTEPAAEWIDWGEDARDMRDSHGFQATFVCPAGGEQSTVWGSGVYTDDSSICTAAVHEGLISFADGGVVTIEMVPGISNYSGKSQNGVATRAFGEWEGSFRFVR